MARRSNLEETGRSANSSSAAANDYAVFDLCFDPVSQRYRRVLATENTGAWDDKGERFLDDAGRQLFSKVKRSECVCVLLLSMALEKTANTVVIRINHRSGLRGDSVADSIKLSLLELFEADAFCFSHDQDSGELTISKTEFATLLTASRNLGRGRPVASAPFVWPGPSESDSLLLRELSRKARDIESCFNTSSRRKRARLSALIREAFGQILNALTSDSLRVLIGNTCIDEPTIAVEPKKTEISRIADSLNNVSFRSLSESAKLEYIEMIAASLRNMPRESQHDVLERASLPKIPNEGLRGGLRNRSSREIIRRLKSDYQLSQRDVAELTSIPKSVVGEAATGKSVPSEIVFVALEELFLDKVMERQSPGIPDDVSAEMNQVSSIQSIENTSVPMKTVVDYQAMVKALKSRNMSLRDIAGEVGVSRMTVKRMLEKNNKPPTEQAAKKLVDLYQRKTR